MKAPSLPVLTLLALAISASHPAQAVQTRDCPERLAVEIAGIEADLTADPDDVDFDIIEGAYHALDHKPGISGRAQLRERSAGRCEYAGRSVYMSIYTKQGRDILVVETSLSAKANLRVYARIESMREGNLVLRKQHRYGIMASYNASGHGYADPGPAVASIGYARSFEIAP